jgi:Ca2+-binding EF-hand superfamily protein
MAQPLSDTDKKSVKNEEITWLSTTTFSTANKELGHKVVDIMLGQIVENCEMLEKDAVNNEFSSFEDPDFGPPISQEGEVLRDSLLDFHEKYNLPSTFEYIKKKSDERFNDIVNDKYGENCIYIDREGEFDENEESNDEGNSEEDFDNMEKILKRENDEWREKLKAKPKNFWRWQRATSKSISKTTTTKDGKHVCNLFSQSAMASGPRQGLLNNQWLMGALSLISTRTHMLMGIRNSHQSLIHFPSNPKININSRKYGVYALRFYFNFQWHFILVDDRFLHIEERIDPQILFGHCRDESEMWVSLCEKAYAKACGGYEALNFGYVEEALQVLTGASVSEIRLRYLQAMSNVGKESSSLREQTENVFWKYLTKKIHTGDNVLGCSLCRNMSENVVPGDTQGDANERTGLMEGKPYIILDGKKIVGLSPEHAKNGEEKLLRLRNPWGPREWQCDWSDTSNLTIKYMRKLKKAFNHIPIQYKGITTQHVEPYAFDSSDADFLISLDDWGKYFNCIFIANDHDEEIEKGKWFKQRQSGIVKGGYTDKFELKLKKKIISPEEEARRKRSVPIQGKAEYATVEITLWQEDKRIIDGYKSIAKRDTMTMLITEKGNMDSIENANIPRTKPPCLQPSKHTGRIFLSTTQLMETDQTYTIHANLVESLLKKSKKMSLRSKKAKKIWIEVGSEAPFEFKVVNAKNRPPKLKLNVLNLMYKPMDKTKDIPGSARKIKDQRKKWLKKREGSRQSTFLNLKKMELKGEELPAWMISLDDIKQEMEAMDDAKYEAKTEDLDSDNEDDENNNGEVDDRLAFWKSLRKEQWDSEPPAFDDDFGNPIKKDKSGDEPPPAFDADPTGIDAEAEMEARKAALLLQKINFDEYDTENEIKTSKIPRSPYRSPNLNIHARDTVVFRGQLIMNVEYEKDSSYDSTVLVTVIEKLNPVYCMEFSITHPGENMTATRSFTTRNIETILATKPASLRRIDEDSDPKYVESEQAVQRWIDSGDLPDHDDLVTWLIGRMKFNLLEENLVIPSVDKNSKGSDDNEEEDEIENAENAVIRMTEDEDDSDTDSDQSYGELYDATGGDESMAPGSDEEKEGKEEKEEENEDDDDEFGDYDFDERDGGDRGQPEIEGKTAREMIESVGITLKASDPFAAASFAASSELKRTKQLEKQRARVAKVREDTIYRRARAKRAKEAYAKHMKHLQAKELGRAIMMQEMAMTIEEKAKRSVAWDMRLKSSMRRQTNPYKQNGTKSLPGPVIGPGPISAAAIDNRGEMRQMRENSKWVFDMNGRRHLRKSMGKVYEGPPVERVIKKIQDQAKVKSANWRLDFRKPFSQFDKNGDGKLSHDEFLDGISHLGIEMDEEERDAMLKHFDSNNNGFILYNEFIWAFYNKRELVTQWRLQKGPGKRSDTSLLNSFFKYDIDGSRKLGRKEFKYALEDIGLKIEDWEVETLADKFDADRDGLINPTEFLAFMHSLEANEKKRREEAQQNKRELVQSTNKTGNIPKTSERIQYEKLKILVRAQKDELARLKKFVEQQERMQEKRQNAKLICQKK